MINRKTNFIFFLLATGLLSAQQDVQMADAFYSEGKVYVVVIVVSILVIGILAYLFFLDRKLSKLEKEVDKKK